MLGLCMYKDQHPFGILIGSVFCTSYFLLLLFTRMSWISILIRICLCRVWSEKKQHFCQNKNVWVHGYTGVQIHSLFNWTRMQCFLDPTLHIARPILIRIMLHDILAGLQYKQKNMWNFSFSDQTIFTTRNL